jgi:hypothetical protein
MSHTQGKAKTKNDTKCLVVLIHLFFLLVAEGTPEHGRWNFHFGCFATVTWHGQAPINVEAICRTAFRPQIISSPSRSRPGGRTTPRRRRQGIGALTRRQTTLGPQQPVIHSFR